MRQTPGFDPFSILTSSRPTCRSSMRSSTARKAKQQGVALTDLYETLQVYLGSAYVNDFNLFGRTYRSTRRPMRSSATSRRHLAAEGAQRAGQMVPIGRLVEVSQSYGPDPVVRFNGYPAADLRRRSTRR
jgi:multidrug efflux pump